jgi:hypothetical protein
LSSLAAVFLSEGDERRVRQVAETIAGPGERVVAVALGSPALLSLSAEEERLARSEPS